MRIRAVMDVAPEISALTGSNVAISEQVNAPIINKRSAQSRVASANGQTIVIGGLMEDRKDEQVQKIPLLGDLPIIGAAFQAWIAALALSFRTPPWLKVFCAAKKASLAVPESMIIQPGR